ncbi:MAG: DUF2330 domain-containing protein [Acidobacteriota bacterium]
MVLLCGLLLPLLAPRPASAFCGFYVAKADTGLYNQASKVVVVRDGDRTVVTMANDFRGDPREFALVVPVPTRLEREQIHVAERGLIDHLDAYTAPRLVEYFDPDPCARAERMRFLDLELRESTATARSAVDPAARAKSLGVTIEATYTVGEYDIAILSAEQSHGLATWLKEEGYRLPPDAAPVLGSYLKQQMRFFVARVNLEEQSKLGYTYLRPLQVAYETPKFMLPLRLGTVNALGAQELFAWVLTRTGRVETRNYRTVRLPTDVGVPEYVEHDFGRFYRDLFLHQAEKERRRAVFLEYAWDMSWCDPCAADPPSSEQLRRLGVFWADAPNERRGAGADVFVTRLHLSYTAETFPEDLFFQETGDRQNFQGRFILQRPFRDAQGKIGRECAAGARYAQEVSARQEREAETLARLTGWPLKEIRARMDLGAPAERSQQPWWRSLWTGGSRP